MEYVWENSLALTPWEKKIPAMSMTVAEIEAEMCSFQFQKPFISVQ